MVGSFLAPKWSIMVPFCGMDHQKSIFDRVHRSGLSMSFFLLLLRRAFRQFLILDKTFMLLMSAQCPHMFPYVPTCPHMSPHVPSCPQIMSPHVPTCPHMSPHVPKCPQISPNVPKCPQISPNVLKCSQMSSNVPKCPQNVQKMSAMHSVKFLSWIRKPESLILDKKTGKSDLG